MLSCAPRNSLLPLPGPVAPQGAAQQLMHLAIAAATSVEWLFVIHMYQRTQVGGVGVGVNVGGGPGA